jgi:hypothetical protein
VVKKQVLRYWCIIVEIGNKKLAFSADFNALISPKFRAVKIYTIREIRSQNIPV